MLKQPKNPAVALRAVGARRSLAKGTAAVLLTSLVATAPLIANARDTTVTESTDPAVISEWNEIAQKTLLADTTKAVPADFLYMGLCMPPSTTP
jgi:hypothetical protein